MVEKATVKDTNGEIVDLDDEEETEAAEAADAPAEAEGDDKGEEKAEG